MDKTLIPLHDNEVAPRFDLATDVLIVRQKNMPDGSISEEEKLVVLDQPSAEAICRLVLSENIQTVICAGIEDEFYQFLKWKGVNVLDDVIGPVDQVLRLHKQGRIVEGLNLYPHN